LFAIISNVSMLDALILAVLQGVAEFLPISSSAHLALVQYFRKMEHLPNFFDVMLHIGTLLAVVWYYRRMFFLKPGEVDADEMPILSDRKQFINLAFWLILAMLPAVGAKLIFKETKEGQAPTFFTTVGDMRDQASDRPTLVLFFLACTSVVLLVASRAPSGNIGVQSMKWHHALLIGIAQALSALCPGLSRSGMTISTSLLLGLKAPWAVNFSLLLSIPVILAAAVYEGRKIETGWASSHIPQIVVGIAVSAIVGWASIGLLAASVRRHRWGWFAVYLWVLIAVVATALWLNAGTS
jgi:undecaprenyl-diphosphatase